MDIVVIGAGVIGLTSAITLKERGHRVRCISATPPLESTSAAAGAVWYPAAGAPREWSCESLVEFRRLAEVSASGVSLRPARKYFHRRMGPPWWRDLFPDFELLAQKSVPAEFRCGYSFTVPVIDMAIYLGDYLPRRLGVAIEHGEISTLGELAGLKMNCAGMGAGALAGDPTLTPDRGETVLVDARLSEVFLDSDNPRGRVYVVPRSRGTLVENLEVAKKLFPQLVGDELARYVGFRPMRETVRVERVGQTIHHYGHGGAGVTLSWGSARAAVSLMTELS